MAIERYLLKTHFKLSILVGLKSLKIKHSINNKYIQYVIQN